MHSVAQVRNDRRVTSRWDEIRAANAIGTQSASWDALRQGQSSSSDLELPKSMSPVIREAQSARAQEQARFDAMLEAERKAARS